MVSKKYTFNKHKSSVWGCINKVFRVNKKYFVARIGRNQLVRERNIWHLTFPNASCQNHALWMAALEWIFILPISQVVSAHTFELPVDYFLGCPLDKCLVNNSCPQHILVVISCQTGCGHDLGSSRPCSIR